MLSFLLSVLASLCWWLLLAAVAAVNALFVAGGVMGTVMIAQFLEYGVVTTLHHSKWGTTKTHTQLRVLFYRWYWGISLLYLLCAALWVYLSERTTSKVAYGVAFVFLWELFQLVIAVMLSSWEDGLLKMKELGKASWMRTLLARLASLKQSSL